MWEWVKQVMVDSTREMYCSVRVEEKNPKNVWWNGVIKTGGGLIWKLCNMAFESGVVFEDWSSAVIFPLYKGKEERIEYKNYRGIIMLSVVIKIYAGTLVDSL